MNFQRLPVNHRTFQLLLRYIDFISNNSSSCFELDNIVQVGEMEQYIQGTRDSAGELLLQWVRENGGDFRAYLNSIKIAALILISQGISEENLSYEKFEQTCLQINLKKEHCLDSLF